MSMKILLFKGKVSVMNKILTQGLIFLVSFSHHVKGKWAVLKTLPMDYILCKRYS